MAFLGEIFGGAQFDAETVEPLGEFVPLPEGWYEAMIVESELKDTKNSDGQYLFLTLQVIDGECSGHKLFDRLNLQNANATAVKIAQQALSAICRAIGVTKLSDSSQLHDRPFGVKVVYVPAKGEYGEKNDIKGYCAVADLAEKRLNGRKGAAPKATVTTTPYRPTTPQAPPQAPRAAAPAPAPAAPIRTSAPTPPPPTDNRPIPGPSKQPWRRNGAEGTKQEAQQDDTRGAA